MFDPKIKQASKTDALYKKAKEVFNKYIRLRDKHEGCITHFLPNCTGVVEHATHCFSAHNYPDLEFDEINTNGGCRICNYYNHDKTTEKEHLKSIEERHGKNAVDELVLNVAFSKLTGFFKPDEDYYRNIIHKFQKKIAKEF
jgi:hypothetical protein